MALALQKLNCKNLSSVSMIFLAQSQKSLVFFVKNAVQTIFYREIDI